VLGVQQHVEQRELDLAQRLHAALEVLGRHHLVEQRARQRLAGVHMGGHVRSTSHSQQKFSMNWLGSSTASHSTPLMPGHVAFVHLGQHVVQAVAELVEQGDDVVVRQQRRLAIHAVGKVAHQVRHRGLQGMPVSGRSQRVRTSSIQAPPRLPLRAGWSR
jgi:hypothetical protein